jgi:hypothetical protein
MKRISGSYWLDDIFFSATSRAAIPTATKQAVGLLRERHHLHPDEPDDFNIRSPEDVIRAQLQASACLRNLRVPLFVSPMESTKGHRFCGLHRGTLWKTVI